MGINVAELSKNYLNSLSGLSALNEYGHKEHIPSEDYIFM
jgi:hypothetical protein